MGMLPKWTRSHYLWNSSFQQKFSVASNCLGDALWPPLWEIVFMYYSHTFTYICLDAKTIFHYGHVWISIWLDTSCITFQIQDTAQSFRKNIHVEVPRQNIERTSDVEDSSKSRGISIIYRWKVREWRRFRGANICMRRETDVPEAISSIDLTSHLLKWNS